MSQGQKEVIKFNQNWKLVIITILIGIIAILAIVLPLVLLDTISLPWDKDIVQGGVVFGRDVGWFFAISFWQTGLLFALLLIASVPVIFLLAKGQWGKPLICGAIFGLIIGVVTLMLYLYSSNYGYHQILNREHIFHINDQGEMIYGNYLLFSITGTDWTSASTSTWILQDDLSNITGDFFILIDNPYDSIAPVQSITIETSTGIITSVAGDLLDGTNINSVGIVSTAYTWEKEVGTWFSIITIFFTSALRFIVVPMIFTAILLVIIKDHSGTGQAKKFAASFGFYAFSALIGILIAMALTPLLGLVNPSFGGEHAREDYYQVSNIWLMIFGWVPSAIGDVLTGTAVIISVILVSLFFGFVLKMLGKKGRQEDIVIPTERFFTKFQTVIAEAIDWILVVIPLVIMTAIPKFFMGNAVDNFVALGTFLGAVYLGSFIAMFIQTQITILARRNSKGYIQNTKDYFKSYGETLMLGFTTQSTAGCLPKIIESNKEFGLDDSVSNMTTPMGSSMGLVTCGGMYPAMVAIMTAQTMDYDMNIGFWIILIVAGIVISYGTAGIPGTATVSTISLLSALGFTTAIYVPLISLEQLVDPMRTMANVNGVVATTTLVDRFTISKKQKNKEGIEKSKKETLKYKRK